MCPEERAALHARLSRRALLGGSALGFGALAFNMLTGGARAVPALRGPRRPSKVAKNVIALYMDGGVSHLDTFDPKPRLDREHGQPIGIDIPRTQFDEVGKLLRSPWAFRPGGESGIAVSDRRPRFELAQGWIRGGRS